MRQKIIEIKGLSRENLLGKFPLPIAVYLLMLVIVSLISSPFQRMMQNGATDLNITHMLIGLVGEIIVMLIAILFGAGLTKIHLNIARRQEPSMKDFAFPFKNHPDKFMGYGVLLALIAAACSLPGSICLGIGAAMLSDVHIGAAALANTLLIAGIVLLIAGVIVVIILMLGFALTTYILLDDPYGAKVISAMKQSWQYMKKRKGTLFLLSLSFIGLFIIGILSFGIGLLWIEQYYLQSSVVFYLKIKEEHMEYREILEGNIE